MEREKLVALVAAVQGKEKTAVTELYDVFYGDIYYHILKTVNNDSDLAADLTQDTFVQILESIDQLEEPAAFVTWSQRIAFSKCTGYFKKKKEFLADEEEDGYSIFDTQEETREDFLPDEALDKEDLKQTIQKMINELPEEQRSALLLRYFNEISVKEIAEIQGVSEGTVKSRLNYARKAIKASVEEYEKKNDIKLHCAGVIPLLLWFFRAYRSANGIPLTATAASAVFESGANVASAAPVAATATTATSTVAGASAAAAAGTAATTSGVGAIASIISTKTIAIIAAAAVAIGGVSIGVSLTEDRNDIQAQSITSNFEDTQIPSFEDEELLQEQYIDAEIIDEENTTDADADYIDNHIWEEIWLGELDDCCIRYRFCSECFEYECLFQKEGKSGCDHKWNNGTLLNETHIVEYRYCMWYDCQRHEWFSLYQNTCQHQWKETSDPYGPYECISCGCKRMTRPKEVIEETENEVFYYEESPVDDGYVNETEETMEDVIITITPIGSTEKDSLELPNH